MCLVNKNKSTQSCERNASSSNVKKDPHKIKLPTDECPQMGGILSVREIFDHHMVFRGEHQKTACRMSGNMGLVHVRAAESSRKWARGAPFHLARVHRNHIVIDRCEWSSSVPPTLTVLLPCLHVLIQRSWKQ